MSFVTFSRNRRGAEEPLCPKCSFILGRNFGDGSWKSRVPQSSPKLPRKPKITKKILKCHIFHGRPLGQHPARPWHKGWIYLISAGAVRKMKNLWKSSRSWQGQSSMASPGWSQWLPRAGMIHIPFPPAHSSPCPRNYPTDMEELTALDQEKRSPRPPKFRALGGQKYLRGIGSPSPFHGSSQPFPDEMLPPGLKEPFLVSVSWRISQSF